MGSNNNEVSSPIFNFPLSLLTALHSIALLLGDLVLNIDNPTTDAIAPASRIALAFLSAAAVRSAGFQGVSIAALTPAVQCALPLCVCRHFSRLFQDLVSHHDVHRDLPNCYEVVTVLFKFFGY